MLMLALRVRPCAVDVLALCVSPGSVSMVTLRISPGAVGMVADGVDIAVMNVLAVTGYRQTRSAMSVRRKFIAG